MLEFLLRNFNALAKSRDDRPKKVKLMGADREGPHFPQLLRNFS